MKTHRAEGRCLIREDLDIVIVMDENLQIFDVREEEAERRKT